MLAPTEAETKQIKRKTAIKMVSRHNKRWKRRRFVRLNAAMPAELQRKLAERDAAAEQIKVAASSQAQSANNAVATAEQTQTAATANQAGENTTTGQQPSANTVNNLANNAVVQQELNIVKQELAQTKAENQRLNNELASLKAAQKQTATQSKANQEIQVQLDALRHELDELKTILAQKDNHIKVLQASLKDASQAIKSQHADNMRLYNKLKELSPESIAAAVKSSNNQATLAKPQIKLAAVTNTEATVTSQASDDTGAAKVWADELSGNSNAANKALNATNSAGVVQDGSSVTLSQILSSQSSEAMAGQAPNQVEDAGFTFSISRSAAVSPIAWAAVLISFIFILFLIIRALLMQNELRRLEDS